MRFPRLFGQLMRTVRRPLRDYSTLSIPTKSVKQAPSSFLKHPQNPLMRAYARISLRYPHRVASVTACSILVGADCVAQSLTRSHGEAWDFRRMVALGTFGAFYYGGPCKLFYLAYERFGLSVVSTVLVDVFVHTPFLLVPTFYLVTGTVKGQTLSSIGQQLKSEWREASLGSCLYWTPMQIICFTFVPQHSRIAFISVASFAHKTWLSWVSNRDAQLMDLEDRLEPEQIDNDSAISAQPEES